jgi:hypothetical protein
MFVAEARSLFVCVFWPDLPDGSVAFHCVLSVSASVMCLDERVMKVCRLFGNGVVTKGVITKGFS